MLRKQKIHQFRLIKDHLEEDEIIFSERASNSTIFRNKKADEMEIQLVSYSTLFRSRDMKL